MNSPQQPFLLWDLPTRIFHWSLAACVVAALVTGQVGGNWIEWHARLGLGIVGLLAFRIVWGLIGSTYARFGQFFPTPGRVRAYLRGQWREPGHNPLGALSVFALLGLLTVQAASGLVANDDIAFVGPLFELIGKDLSNRLTHLHHLAGDALIGLAVLHVAAVVFHVRIRGKNLLKPMLTGRQEGAGPSARGGAWPALVVALLCAGLAVYGASGAWLPAPEVVAPAATPNW